MSKYLKDQITADLTRRLDGVADCVLANVIGLDSEKTFLLRKRLREKDIHVLVVKNTLARRATEGTSLGPAFEGIEGSSAIVWGGEDFVSLVKEVTELDKDEEFEEFSALGGAMDGEQLTPDRVKEISKWPSRQEQLSMLAGQILGPGSTLQAQLIGPGGTLASQIKQKSEEEGAE
ncbi:MAG: 50S ribosomal protein L10 [Planctomycetota bacterium]|jgi:ribosomal protein L10|nr:50S ribosomal protein L10 [Pirellulaceae bacterium]MEC7108509.1 50S ribosomal protein L10 [Planctomycetota bacterium]MDP7377492.1 50S ribosomal protein L10 [Pirellulaceae bacterium]MEC7354860.1 50S ribosomal protein L10 [Planctomycetota bacterium]MEC7429118.1 50S ribosomal protein L10 [Planctomycetota bacterium]